MLALYLQMVVINLHYLQLDIVAVVINVLIMALSYRRQVNHSCVFGLQVTCQPLF